MHRQLRRQIDRFRLKDTSYSYLFDAPPSGEVVALDCETTGLNRKKDDIVSIAAILISGTRIVTSQAFRVQVRPQAQLAAKSIKIHQIRNADVERELTIADVLPQLLKFIGPRPLVGYWIDFDMAMLDKSVRPMLGIRLPNPRIDVCDMYYERKYGNAPPGTKLDLRFAAILSDLQLPPLRAHDAFSDALSTAQMYLVLKDLAARGVFLKRSRTWDHPLAPLG